MRYIKALVGFIVGLFLAVAVPFVMAYGCYTQDMWPIEEIDYDPNDEYL